MFSASATVYGDYEVPFVEAMVRRPASNPYGASEAMSEQILMDTAIAHPGLLVTLLR